MTTSAPAGLNWCTVGRSTRPLCAAFRCVATLRRRATRPLGPAGLSRHARHGTARHDTETPDPGQPPLPGTKYLVRISPHFDNPGQKYSDLFAIFSSLFSCLFDALFCNGAETKFHTIADVVLATLDAGLVGAARGLGEVRALPFPHAAAGLAADEPAAPLADGSRPIHCPVIVSSSLR